MSRFHLGILAALLFCGGLLFWLSDNPETFLAPAPHQEEQSKTPMGQASAVQLPAPTVPIGRIAKPTPAPKVTYSTHVEGGIQVTVIDLTTGLPLPGVDLLFCEDGFSDDLFVESGPGLPTIEEIMTRYGSRYQTNSNGQANIPVSDHYYYLGIRTSEYFNFDLHSEEQDFQLYARPPLQIPCLTLDHKQQPAANVSMHLGVGGQDDIWWIQERKTSSKGEATLLVFDRFRSPVGEESMQELEFLVKASTLSLTNQIERVSGSSLPVAPLTFHLEPFGSLDVKLRSGNGEPLLGRYTVSVFSIRERDLADPDSWRPSNQDMLHAVSVQTHSGHASFQSIGFGQSLLVIARIDGNEFSARASLDGPLSENEQVALTLFPEGMDPVYTCRLLNENGFISKNLLAHYSIRQGGSNDELGYGKIRSNDQGLLSFAPDIVLAPGSSALLTIFVTAKDNQPTQGVVVDITNLQSSGLHPLGDLILKRPPLLAQGVVLDPNRQPLAGAALSWSVGFPNPYRPEVIEWEEDDDFETVSGEDGSFALYGFKQKGYYKLTASNPGMISTSKEIEAPDFSAELQLKAAWTLSGTVLLGEATKNIDSFIRFSTEDPNIDDGWIRASVRPDGSLFFVDRFAPGVWTMEFSGMPFLNRTFELGPAGGTHDLGTIDLSAEFERIRIHVTQHSKEDLYFLGAQDLEGREIGREEDGVITILSPSGLDEVLIFASGMKFQLIINPYDGMEVVLESGYPIAILFSEPPKLAPGWSIVMHLSNIDPTQPSYMDSTYNASPEGAFFEVPYPGKFKVQIGLLDLMNARSSGTVPTVPIGGFSHFETIEVLDQASMQEITINIDPGILAEAVALMHANQH